MSDLDAIELDAAYRRREEWWRRMAKSAFRSGCAAGFVAGLLAATAAYLLAVLW